MHLEIFLADFAVLRVFLEISRDFAEKPEFRGSATARNIRSPVSFIFAPLPECTREIAIADNLFRVIYIFFSTSSVLKLVNS